jgi:large conductance mechanosensitive channel
MTTGTPTAPTAANRLAGLAPSAEHLKRFGKQSQGLAKEFREFAAKGNVVDLAVGVIIGAAFGKIVSSLVADVIMPPLGLLVGGVNFTSLSLTLKAAEGDAPAVLLKYGTFIQTVFDFTIVALAVFAVVKGINRMKRAEAAKAAEPAPPPAPTAEVALLTQIRDILGSGAKA